MGGEIKSSLKGSKFELNRTQYSYCNEHPFFSFSVFPPGFSFSLPIIMILKIGNYHKEVVHGPTLHVGRAGPAFCLKNEIRLNVSLVLILTWI